MANISKIKLPSGDTYDIKQSNAVVGNTLVFYGVTDTDASEVTKQFTIPGFPSTIPDGTMLVFRCTSGNTARSPKIQINGGIANYLVIKNQSYTTQVEYRSFTGYDTYIAVYDSSQSLWILNSKRSATTSEYGPVQLSNNIDSTSQNGPYAATPYAVKKAYDRADEAYNLANSMAWKKLWSNSNTTANFAAQKITISNLSSYNAFILQFHLDSIQYVNVFTKSVTETGNAPGYCLAYQGNNIMAFRGFNILRSENKLDIWDGQRGTNISDASSCIPIMLHGANLKFS